VRDEKPKPRETERPLRLNTDRGNAAWMGM
jgi:hypothetical protein